MYFYAFPLLLLIASTVCASPVSHTESRDISESVKAIIQALNIDPRIQFKELRNKFRSKKAEPIAEWSDQGEKVVKVRRVRLVLPIDDSIIKKVDLSTVVPANGLTAHDEQHSWHAQLLQVFIEIRNLQQYYALYHYCVTVEEGKPYVYIEMAYPGKPASRFELMEEEKQEARKRALITLKDRHVVLDPEHDQDKYFGFTAELGYLYARPIMLRYATITA